MSITSAKLAIDGTAVKVAEANGMPLEVHLHSASGAVYLGAAGVTSTTGYKFDNGDKDTFTIPDGSALYAISASGTQDLYVLTAIL